MAKIRKNLGKRSYASNKVKGAISGVSAHGSRGRWKDWGADYPFDFTNFSEIDESGILIALSPNSWQKVFSPNGAIVRHCLYYDYGVGFFKRDCRWRCRVHIADDPTPVGITGHRLVFLANGTTQLTYPYVRMEYQVNIGPSERLRYTSIAAGGSPVVSEYENTPQPDTPYYRYLELIVEGGKGSIKMYSDESFSILISQIVNQEAYGWDDGLRYWLTGASDGIASTSGLGITVDQFLFQTR